MCIFSSVVLVIAAVLAVAAPAAFDDAAAATYGRELPIIGVLGIGPSMDVAVRGDRAFVIGHGKLTIADIAEPGKPRVVGSIAGLGSVRQIVANGDIAYVSSREDGLFIVDVADPSQPRLLCHYDTIEWATGLAISGNVLFIACRNFGVELVDVSKPEKPVHLSTVRTGEAQSVVVRGGWLYAGVWGTSEVVVVDIRNLREPKIVSRMPLDGYGDGVDVRGGYLYAATGHHSREWHAAEGDPGYGAGHGLEIFDLGDPSQPKFISRIKFPRFYGLGNDMWSVTVSGDYAFVADTHNGVFDVDIRDPRKPVCVARRKLPPPTEKNAPDFAGGLALARDIVYVAGGGSDLHILSAPGLAVPPVPEPDTPPRIPPAAAAPPGEKRYRPGGQVHAAAVSGDRLYAVCGAAGLHVLQAMPSPRLLATRATEGFATDVAVNGDRVYVAEGTGGLSIWSAAGADAPRLIGRYRAGAMPVRHIAVPGPGRYALLQCGASTLQIVNVSDPAAPVLELQATHLGLLYGNQILGMLVDNRYAAVFWHVTGLYWYDLYGGDNPVPAAERQASRFSPQDGVAVYNGQLITPRKGGLIAFNREETRALDDLPIARIPGMTLRGKPVIAGNRLYLTDRAAGTVMILDIADPAAPKLIDSFTTAGNPGRVVAVDGGFVIPDGYEGLLYFDNGDGAWARPDNRQAP